MIYDNYTIALGVRSLLLKPVDSIADYIEGVKVNSIAIRSRKYPRCSCIATIMWSHFVENSTFQLKWKRNQIDPDA